MWSKGGKAHPLNFCFDDGANIKITQIENNKRFRLVYKTLQDQQITITCNGIKFRFLLDT